MVGNDLGKELKMSKFVISLATLAAVILGAFTPERAAAGGRDGCVAGGLA
jgi:hypothetical protein